MRSIGVICVGLGVILFIMSVFPLTLAKNSEELLLGVVCAGGIAFPVTLLGIILTRRAARQTGVEGEAVASDAFRQRAGMALMCLGGAEPGSPDANGTRLERFQSFDLNRLTWGGWLLVLGTVGFMLTEATLFSHLILPNRQEPGPVGVIALPILLPIGFSSVGWLLLKAFGVPFCDPRPTHCDSSGKPFQTR